MSKRFLKPSVFSLLVAAGLLSIMSVAGCPAPQTPTAPPSEEEGQAAQPDVPTTDNGLPRPIEPPILDDDTTTSDSDGTVPTGPGGGGGGDDDGGAGEPGLVMISIGQPTDDIAVAAPPRAAQGTIINLEFTLIDFTGAVNGGRLLLARDDNADAQPDGAPVYTQSLAISAGANTWAFDTTTVVTNNLLNNSFGRFVLGARATTVSNDVIEAYATATITIDGIAPTVTWVGAGPTQDQLDVEDHLVNRDTTWTVNLQTSDNSPHTWRVLLDMDLTPENGTEFQLVPETDLPADSGVRTPPSPLTLAIYPAGTYYYYVIVSDDVEPAERFYAPGTAPGTYSRLAITSRLIGEYDLNDLAEQNHGAILEGFNFNDLAGSAMVGVPDIDGDNDDEFVIVSRFGKPYAVSHNGVGFGEAYMIYGSPQGLTGVEDSLNTVGTDIPGLPFAGIRTPIAVAPPLDPNDPDYHPARSIAWTEGISDVTTIADMDGDDLPEIVFSFPRIESVSLQNDAAAVQEPDLRPDRGWMGAAEFDAFDYSTGEWTPNQTQFARGGVVIVSSHNDILKDPDRQNRKFDRLMDLHEVGQMFGSKEGGSSGMGFPEFVPYLKDDNVEAKTTMCDGEETEYDEVTLLWDVIMTNQGPGGFENEFTGRPFDDPTTCPPLSNFNWIGLWISDLDARVAPVDDACGGNCVLSNRWYRWGIDGDYFCFPFTDIDTLTQTCVGADGSNPSWHGDYFFPGDPIGSGWNGNQDSIWTGFYGRATPHVDSERDLIGARVLGQRVDDHFGTTIGSDGTWLYIGSPRHTAIRGDAVAGDDVSELPTLTRDDSGVVYLMRTDARPYPGSSTSYTQLWIEPGTRFLPDPDPEDEIEPNEPIAWPYVDVEAPDRTDWTMPVPHNYVIEDVGSIRGRDQHWAGAPGTLIVTEPPEGHQLDRNDQIIEYSHSVASRCSVDDQVARGWLQADAPVNSGVYGGFVAVESVEYYVDRTPQIVGPHQGAQLGHVRALGDVNDDGIMDFAVGSTQLRTDFSDPASPTVGGVFVVYGRPTGFQTANDILLERVGFRRADPDRVDGVLLKGADGNDQLGWAFGKVGNSLPLGNPERRPSFNGDEYADVVVGNEGDSSNSGEVLVIFGSEDLRSPGPITDDGPIPGDPDGVDAFGGWTPDAIVNSLHAIRFVGEAPGDMAGANVAGIGDVDNDGFGDILIAAPGAGTANQGIVYLIYGSEDYTGGQTFSLAQVGSVECQGVRFLGRDENDYLGGGSIAFPNAENPIYLNPDQVPVTVYSKGVAGIGDVNGDGKADYAISAMLADVHDEVYDGVTNAGEVYVIYGRGD